MGQVGVEPTQAQTSRFTVCPDSPTSALTLVRETAQTLAGGRWCQTFWCGDGKLRCMLREMDLHQRPRGYEPRELLLLHPAIYNFIMANGVKDRFMGSAAAASGEYLSERCPGRFLGAKLRRFRVTCKYSAGYSRREKIFGNGIVRLFCRCHFVFQRVTA